MYMKRAGNAGIVQAYLHMQQLSCGMTTATACMHTSLTTTPKPTPLTLLAENPHHLLSKPQVTTMMHCKPPPTTNTNNMHA
jgi:hypothetical protein